MAKPAWYHESDFCNICGDTPDDPDALSYMLNPPGGGYDLPETWVCRKCVLDGKIAEDKAERIRERYPEDFKDG